MNKTHKHQMFLRICATLSENAKCLSRHIGCVIVKDNIILGAGYNGPPKGYPHCIDFCAKINKTAYEFCPSVHAEQNAIINAKGKDLTGAALYLNNVLPCKICMGMIINAGITTIVQGHPGSYDNLSELMVAACSINVIVVDDYRIIPEV